MPSSRSLALTCALLCGACHQAPPGPGPRSESDPPAAEEASEPAPPTAADRLYPLLERGDLRACYPIVRDLFADAGLESLDVELVVTDYEKIMCWYSSVHRRITVTRMIQPEEGRAFWTYWSTFLDGGSWTPETTFADARDMQLLANYLMLSLLVHEFSHHIQHVYGQFSAGSPRSELEADYLCIGALNDLAQDPRFARLRRLYHEVCTRDRVEQIPEASRVPVSDDIDWTEHFKQHPSLPSDTRSYVAQHWSRQRVLLARHAEGLRDMAELQLLPRRRDYTASRRYVPAVDVETLGPLAEHRSHLRGDFVGFGYRSDKAGDMAGIEVFHKQELLWSLRLADHPELELNKVYFGGELLSPQSFVFSDLTRDRRFVVTREEAQIHVTELPDFASGAFWKEVMQTKDGRLHVLTTSGGVKVGVLNAERTEWTTAIQLSKGGYRYGDGEQASLQSSRLVADSRGNYVFGDYARNAVRVITPRGIFTLAGGLPGSRDGAGEAARFTAPTVLEFHSPNVLYVQDGYGETALLRRVRFSPEALAELR